MEGWRVFFRRIGVPMLLASLVAAACNPLTESAPKAGVDIVIGVPNSATGSLSAEGGLSKQGYDVWQDWANRDGGILVKGVRHKVQLVYADDQSVPTNSAQLAESMITDQKVQFLLSPYGSSTTAAVAPVAEQHHIPHVSSNSADRNLFLKGLRYTFGIMAPADRYVQTVEDWEVTLNPRPKTMAILTADDLASLYITQQAVNYGQTKGLQAIAVIKYPAGTTNLYPLMQQVKPKNPDILFNSGHFLEAVAAHKAAKDLGLDSKIFIYSVGPTQPEFTQALGSVADFVIAGAPWTAQAKFKADYGPSIVDYVQSYRQKFHTQNEPTFITADATAAGLALQLAIEHAQSLDPAKVRDALAALDSNTFYGRIKFDAQGENTYHNALIMQIQDGQRQTIFPPELASAEPKYPAPTWEARFGIAAQPPKAKLPGTGQPPSRR